MIGDQTVLVVEVNTTVGNSKTKQDITRSVFGNGEGIDLTSVYKTCSHNKLNLVKATNRNATLPGGNDIIDGTLAWYSFLEDPTVPLTLLNINNPSSLLQLIQRRSNDGDAE